MKLTTDVTLLFHSAADNNIFFIFYAVGVGYEINSIHQQCILFFELVLGKNLGKSYKKNKIGA